MIGLRTTKLVVFYLLIGALVLAILFVGWIADTHLRAWSLRFFGLMD